MQDIRGVKVAILGAGGFVGRALLQPNEDFQWIAVQRSPPADQVRDFAEWRSCDLLDPVQAEIALAGAEAAVFLVHSMAPRGIELQGEFSEIDALIALNVAEAARAQGVKRIVYLGGLLPPNHHLSRHLQSRLEVESILRTAGCPVISLRAGIVIGAHGSSFEMMAKLVRRLPVMLAPAWTRSQTEAVALGDVVHALRASLLLETAEHAVFDLGSGEALTYRDLMRETARVMGLRRVFVPLPSVNPRLSVLWVALITGARPELVRPLVQSLLENMLPRDAHRFPWGRAPQSLASALKDALAARRDPARRRVPKKRPRLPHWGFQTRIVSRLPYFDHVDELATGHAYFEWLGRWLPWVIRVVPVSRDTYRVFFGPFTKAFLILSHHREQERPGAAVFEIEQGLLVRRGRAKAVEPVALQSFTFRRSKEARIALGVIENYTPWLPRWTYRWTQALAHAWVMRLFAVWFRRTYGAKAELLSEDQQAGPVPFQETDEVRR